jgi:MOSC domain-containing protein YiiM
MPPDNALPTVVAVSLDTGHNFSKPVVDAVTLIAGVGVEGDSHAGETVQHLYLVRKNASAPNRRQVHLMHSELFAEVAELGFTVTAGQLGENVTTAGIDLLDLPLGTRLHLGATAVIELTGLRDPCKFINSLEPKLMKAMLGKDSSGKVVRKSGVMSIVLTGGVVRAGDAIRIELPAGTPQKLPVV